MAKSNGPLFSMEARGTVGDCLTFSKRKSGQQVRFQRKQKDRITALRTANRSIFLAAVAAWSALTSEQKAVYNERAKSQNLTGYNLYVSEYMSVGVDVLLGHGSFTISEDPWWLQSGSTEYMAIGSGVCSCTFPNGTIGKYVYLTAPCTLLPNHKYRITFDIAFNNMSCSLRIPILTGDGVINESAHVDEEITIGEVAPYNNLACIFHVIYASGFSTVVLSNLTLTRLD